MTTQVSDRARQRLSQFIARAFAGENVPELPDWMRINIERYRARLKELSWHAAEAHHRGGAEELDRVWREGVDRISAASMEEFALVMQPIEMPPER